LPSCAWNGPWISDQPLWSERAPFRRVGRSERLTKRTGRTIEPSLEAKTAREALREGASRSVRSWRLSNTTDVSFCLRALEEAFARFQRLEIINTDPVRNSPAPPSPARARPPASGRGCASTTKGARAKRWTGRRRCRRRGERPAPWTCRCARNTLTRISHLDVGTIGWRALSP
jgi:hypothetical protein